MPSAARAATTESKRSSWRWVASSLSSAEARWVISPSISSPPSLSLPAAARTSSGVKPSRVMPVSTLRWTERPSVMSPPADPAAARAARVDTTGVSC
jgi:hypothetical protein